MNQDEEITIRPLKEEDAEWLASWLSDERVLRYYEGRDRPHDLALVKENFFIEEPGMMRCLIAYQGTPIGYGQFYPLESEEKIEYGYEHSELVYGMDQFIGNPAYWDRGIGTKLVMALRDLLLASAPAKKVVMDPQAWNSRAIRCYEKCGFRKIKLLPAHEWHEGQMRDCWLMEWSFDS